MKIVSISPLREIIDGTMASGGILIVLLASDNNQQFKKEKINNVFGPETNLCAVPEMYLINDIYFSNTRLSSYSVMQSDENIF